MAITVKILLILLKQLVEEFGDKYKNLSEKERYEFFREYGLKYELEKLKTDLENFRVPFDNWFSESTLYGSGKIENAMNKLKRTVIFSKRTAQLGSVQQHLAMTKTVF